MPIGRPLANTKIHLVDSSFKLVPLGATGELCVGGVGLARRYLNQPALTAEKFVPQTYTAGSIAQATSRVTCLTARSNFWAALTGR